jgi:hypothetical protein
MTVTYPLPASVRASAAMIRTMRNDCSLLFAARSAGLVRILVSNFPDRSKGEDMAELPLGKALCERLYHSEICSWCDSCLKVIGSDISYGEY